MRAPPTHQQLSLVPISGTACKLQCSTGCKKAHLHASASLLWSVGHARVRVRMMNTPQPTSALPGCLPCCEPLHGPCSCHKHAHCFRSGLCASSCRSWLRLGRDSPCQFLEASTIAGPRERSKARHRTHRRMARRLARSSEAGLPRLGMGIPKNLKPSSGS